MRFAHLLLLLALAATAVSAHSIPGSSCGTVTPEDRYDCCTTKADHEVDDDYCKQAYPELYSPPGSSCGTVNPDDTEQCCKDKIEEDEEDEWCQENYPELYADGSSCSTVTPGQNEQCCKDKIAEGEDDEWCQENYPDLYVVGGSCSTVTPGQNKKCCKDKIKENVGDEWCKENYPELYNQGGNVADFPYMAYIESTKAPNGVCGGSLVAPGYVLTAAQCVFKDGEAAAASDVKVWVDGKEYAVETVLVDLDNAQFAEFQNSKSENSWDVAMLALATDSSAKYVALPLSDVPQLGEWIDTTAWQEAKTSVETAKVPVWDGCPPGWADEFCAGGGGFLQACPDDKGSPAMAGNTQVGLTSGPGCDGTPQDYGYFLKLSDKGILEQITVWLNSRGGTGLDANIQNWLIEANTYLYGRK